MSAAESKLEKRVRKAESEVERIRDAAGVAVEAYRQLVDGKLVKAEETIESLRRLIEERDVEIQALMEQLWRYRRNHITVTDLAASDSERASRRGVPSALPKSPKPSGGAVSREGET